MLGIRNEGKPALRLISILPPPFAAAIFFVCKMESLFVFCSIVNNNNMTANKNTGIPLLKNKRKLWWQSVKTKISVAFFCVCVCVCLFRNHTSNERKRCRPFPIGWEKKKTIKNICFKEKVLLAHYPTQTLRPQGFSFFYRRISHRLLVSLPLFKFKAKNSSATAKITKQPVCVPSIYNPSENSFIIPITITRTIFCLSSLLENASLYCTENKTRFHAVSREKNVGLSCIRS